jgi:hypothetical protein
MSGVRWAAAFLIACAAMPATAQPLACSDGLGPDTAEKFVHERLRFWQERLNLHSWSVVVTMTRLDDLKNGTLGGIRWDKRKKTASLSVLAQEDYKSQPCHVLRDMEFTVVHELLHLQLASLPRNEGSRSREEEAVNNIARALLGIMRDGDLQASAQR